MQPAAQHQPHADPGTDGDEGEAVDVAAVPVRALGQGCSVGVVLDHQRVPEGSSQLVQHDGLVPAWQRAGQRQGIASRVVHTRAAQHGLADVTSAQPGLGAELGGQLAEFGDQAVGRGCLDRQRRSGAYGTGQVADRPAQELAADVEREHETGLGPDLVEHGSRPGGTGADSGGAGQAGPLEVAQGQRHGRLRQLGQPGQIRPGHLAAIANEPEQQLLVHGADELRPCWRAVSGNPGHSSSQRLVV